MDFSLSVNGSNCPTCYFTNKPRLSCERHSFVGNVEAGERSAMMMSLVSSAKRHDLDVGLYVADVLDQLLAGSTDYNSLLPDQWKQHHPKAIREYRQEERRDKADRKQYNADQRRLARIQAAS